MEFLSRNLKELAPPVQHEQLLSAIEWTLIGIAIVLGLARLDLRFNHRQEGFILRDLFYFFALATAITNTAIDTALWHRGIGVFEEDVDFGVVQWSAPRDNIIAAFRRPNAATNVVN
ncbi:unnamed protein product [Clonostachys rosea]|uniref:Uncharacterized protein n=1 Tax=Bionectria ochroleuca TaxID=29856 RepID=A0ABY6UH28_BIOOC|nr:unnamed protein product [Clonostachys rosea]